MTISRQLSDANPKCVHGLIFGTSQANEQSLEGWAHSIKRRYKTNGDPATWTTLTRAVIGGIVA